MKSIKIYLFYLIGLSGIALVNSVKDLKLDTKLVNLFIDPQRQNNDNPTVYRLLEEANALFESEVEPEHPSLGNYREIVKQLVDRCRPWMHKFTECPTKEEYQKYNALTSIRAPAIGFFLKSCKEDMLEESAPLLINKIQQDVKGIERFVYLVDKNFNIGPYEERFDPAKYGPKVSWLMLNLNYDATSTPIQKLIGGKKVYEVKFQRIIESNCQKLVEKADPRIEFYGSKPFGHFLSRVSDVVLWNTVTKHCRLILDNKKLVMDLSYKHLKANYWK